VEEEIIPTCRYIYLYWVVMGEMYPALTHSFLSL
jgi:hypothetical protein